MSPPDKPRLTFFTPWRLRWYPRFLALSFAISIPISIVGGSGTEAWVGRVGGDFPAFYGAGRILAEGRGRELYTWKTQAAFQTGLLAVVASASANSREQARGFLAYSYPPFVALAYWPLSFLPYQTAYLVHTALLIIALWFAVQLIRPMLPRVDRWAVEGFCLAFTFMPIFRAITGGQNTTITLLLWAAAWRGYCDKRDILAGTALGLMLFKPQFALPMICLFLLRGRFRILPGVAAIACFLYALSAVMSGWDWPALWWPKTVEFHLVDQAVNAGNSVGWLGFAHAIFGAQSKAAVALGWLLTLATAVALALAWWKNVSSLELLMAITAAALVLIQPHAMFYDAGLAILSMAVIADQKGRGAIVYLLAIWSFSVSAIAGQIFGFNPVFFSLLACAALTIQSIRSKRRMNSIQ